MLMTITDWLWSYVLIGALLIVGVRFTIGSRYVQIRLFRRALAVLSDIEWRGSERGISSFQALTVSVAGRVGGGNIAGVAVAITLGGPGALFWMWLIALLGMSTSLFECALAQLYKRRHGEETFRGGPAYVMRYGLGWRVLPVIYSVLLLVTSRLWLQCGTELRCDDVDRIGLWRSRLDQRAGDDRGHGGHPVRRYSTPRAGLRNYCPRYGGGVISYSPCWFWR